MAEIDQNVMPERVGDTSGVKVDSRPKVIEVQNTTRISMPQEYTHTSQIDDEKHWFAMRVTYSREVKMKETLESKGIECFIPMRYQTKVIRGKKAKILKPVIHNLLFAHATKAEMQEVKKDYEYFIWINPEDLNLKKGTRVRITAGDFEGQEGIFIKVKGARDKRVVIAIKGVIAVAMATLHPSLIEVIKDI